MMDANLQTIEKKKALDVLEHHPGDLAPGEPDPALAVLGPRVEAVGAEVEAQHGEEEPTQDDRKVQRTHDEDFERDLT